MKKISNINIKTISLLGILLGLHIVLSSFYIPVFDNSRIMFTFFIKMLVAIIVGPGYSIIFGFISDIIGHLLLPSGPFFFGYVFTSISSCFIYALCLYNKKLSYSRLIISKLIVNIFCNVILNSLWSYILLSKGYIYYLVQSIIKNILLFPFDILIIVLLFKLLLPVMNKYKITNQKEIKII